MCILQFSTWERAHRWTRCRTTTRLPRKLVFASVFFCFRISDVRCAPSGVQWWIVTLFNAHSEPKYHTKCFCRIHDKAIFFVDLWGQKFPTLSAKEVGLKSFANYMKYLVGPTVGAFISFCWVENRLQILDASVGELRRNMAFSRPSRKSWHRVPLRPLRGYDATHRNIWQGKIWRSRG